ncbi:HesA/MoeB/ThiF family protein [Crossiella cryophila]|uniref:Molybdopterin/thiamine biosynthesis adenylyltransferase n=1 Tax=Crossiella cryophila TaxID=43355 RepID=A0A7W7CAA7_9PSEU|nr:ThiF family adenylyltransferase [Crossiella cryophila]MBB4677441.1 molybdopterin/thiamine biosynthesis adenylyltransferase [Crossiella cryophila]
MNTYDDSAFEHFCAELVNQGFSPVRGTEQQEWLGPVRPSLRTLTNATRMKVSFPEGWPLRYARVTVEGLQTEHAARGVICLWAEDDPAQVGGRDLNVLWERVDEWAAAAQRGFRVEDRALDAYVGFDELGGYHAELPLADLICRGNNGYRAPLTAANRAGTLIIKPGGTSDAGDEGKPRLQGAFYLRRHLDSPPRNLEEIRDLLTNRQVKDLECGLERREPAALAEPSGGHDFIVLAWPRHGSDHDALVVGFENRGASLRATAMAVTPSDTVSRKRRSGPDADLLRDKTVLIAGAGSVGGHVAAALASSGVGAIKIHDSDRLKSVNLVRHVCPEYLTGFPKTLAVSAVIRGHAPWAGVHRGDALSYAPATLAAQVHGVDLVLDCTGVFSLSAALADVCRQTATPLITGALYHAGALFRIRRQAPGDTPIAARLMDPDYLDLPTEDRVAPQAGFLELGCTAPVNNASPIAVLSAAAEISHAAVDFLAGRHHWPDERIVVLRPLQAPFNRTGVFDGPRRGGTT